MIIDVAKFVSSERDLWQELEGWLDRMDNDPYRRMTLGEVRRFHFLYEKASADLARLSTFAFAPEICRYLESLVGRAYGEIHEARESEERGSFRRWFFDTFPRVFRRHFGAFLLSLGMLLLGVTLGAAALRFDPEAREILLPLDFPQETPTQRVAREEGARQDRLGGQHSTFSAYLMTHNLRVSLITLAFGMTAGIGTALFLFYNGVIVGAIGADYIMGGQTKFLFGWLLPHGSIEIPAILVAGQAGFVLGAALLGWRNRAPLRARLRAIGPDLLTLIGGLALMLVWAGIVEAFFSQFHEPVLPYSLKIAFGALELSLLFFFLARAGRAPSDDRRAH
ncbi:MAG: stage II sporulation protein M [Spartobacteria bacterium]